MVGDHQASTRGPVHQGEPDERCVSEIEASAAFRRDGRSDIVRLHLLPRDDHIVDNQLERRGTYDGYGAPNAPVRHAVQYEHLHRLNPAR